MSHVVAQLVDAHLGIRPRFGLAGHEANHEALLRGDLDLYVEYTGTALRRLLGLPAAPPDQGFAIVRDAAAARWPVEWLPPFGFNNSYALLMRRDRAAVLGVRSCADLTVHASSLALGAGEAVIASDPDLRFAPGGVEGLRRAYGLRFKEHHVLPSGYGQLPSALAGRHVDVVVDFPVHPAVHQYDLLELTDDQGFFGGYFAAPVVRRDYLARHPGIRSPIERLAGRVDNRTIARLNFNVELERRGVEEVASAWLREAGLLDVA